MQVKVAVLGATQLIAYNLLPLLFDSCFKAGPLAIILQDTEEQVPQMEGERGWIYHIYISAAVSCFIELLHRI